MSSTSNFETKFFELLDKYHKTQEKYHETEEKYHETEEKYHKATIELAEIKSDLKHANASLIRWMGKLCLRQVIEFMERETLPQYGVAAPPPSSSQPSSARAKRWGNSLLRLYNRRHSDKRIDDLFNSIEKLPSVQQHHQVVKKCDHLGNIISEIYSSQCAAIHSLELEAQDVIPIPTELSEEQKELARALCDFLPVKHE